jgi:hypothetical protein
MQPNGTDDPRFRSAQPLEPPPLPRLVPRHHDPHDASRASASEHLDPIRVVLLSVEVTVTVEHPGSVARSSMEGTLGP